MKSDGARRWKLDLAFLRGGRALITPPLGVGQEEIRWSIRTLPFQGLPIRIVECRMTGLGHEASGYGDSLFFSRSLTQAFAESWERLWMRVLREPGIRNSSGMACGPTPEAAAAKAREELFERAIFLTAWTSRRGWNRLSGPKGILNSVLAACLERLGWRVNLLSIAEVKLGNVVCGLATRDGGGVLFDCCFQPATASAAASQRKVLRSLLRTAAVYDRIPIRNQALPEHGGPACHRDFYRSPANKAAFEFILDGTPDATPLALGSYEEVSHRTLVDVERFPLVAQASNPRWPSLSWGRASISGSNPWPHPLV